MRFNLAINYSARDDIVDAVNAILDEARIEGRLSDLVIDENMISRRLSTAGLPDPDLLIRTSGEMRVSNFLLWQIAYAELYVTDTLWPDFNRAELLRAILDFQRRERRFGGLPTAARSKLTKSRIKSNPGKNWRFGNRRLLAMKRVVTALFLVPVAFTPRCSLPGGSSSRYWRPWRCSAFASMRRSRSHSRRSGMAREF